MQFLKCSNRQEAERLLSKIHAQPEIAEDIAAGRYDRYCDLEQLLADTAGERALPVDTRFGTHEMWEKVFDKEQVGEIDVTRIQSGEQEVISKITWKERPVINDDAPIRPVVPR